MISIRPAEPSESRELTDLAMRSKAHWGYSAEFMASCRAELTVTPEDVAELESPYFVAENRGQRLGFCALERRNSTEFELEALFVEPAGMGCGVGTALISHAVRIAREHGAKSILIQGDPNAAGFYESVGAIRVGERESDSIPGRFLPEYRILL